MSKDLHNDEEITIDLLEIANILKRNAGNIARVTGIFVVAAGVYLATATPVYESQAFCCVLSSLRALAPAFWNPCRWAMQWPTPS